jgi:hypothetical protein
MSDALNNEEKWDPKEPHIESSLEEVKVGLASEPTNDIWSISWEHVSQSVGRRVPLAYKTCPASNNRSSWSPRPCRWRSYRVTGCVSIDGVSPPAGDYSLNMDCPGFCPTGFCPGSRNDMCTGGRALIAATKRLVEHEIACGFPDLAWI